MDPGAALKEARRAAGMSQEHLGAAIGKTASSIAQWEAGRTRPRRDSIAAADEVLEAGGRLVEAFGFVIQRDDVAALREQVRKLAEEVKRLSKTVRDLGGATVPAATPRRRAHH